MINVIIALRRLPPLSEINGDEERMLFELRAIWEVRGELSVSDVYDLAKGKSPATAYRQLLSLRQKGLINFTVLPEDRRKRRIHFTPIAQQLFDALG